MQNLPERREGHILELNLVYEFSFGFVDFFSMVQAPSGSSGETGVFLVLKGRSVFRFRYSGDRNFRSRQENSSEIIPEFSPQDR